MFSLIQSFKSWLINVAKPAHVQDRDDQYLAESSDIHDLERRMRQLDSGRQSPYALSAQGIFAR